MKGEIDDCTLTVTFEVPVNLSKRRSLLILVYGNFEVRPSIQQRYIMKYLGIVLLTFLSQGCLAQNESTSKDEVLCKSNPIFEEKAPSLLDNLSSTEYDIIKEEIFLYSNYNTPGINVNLRRNNVADEELKLFHSEISDAIGARGKNRLKVYYRNEGQLTASTFSNFSNKNIISKKVIIERHDTINVKLNEEVRILKDLMNNPAYVDESWKHQLVGVYVKAGSKISEMLLVVTQDKQGKYYKSIFSKDWRGRHSMRLYGEVEMSSDKMRYVTSKGKIVRTEGEPMEIQSYYVTPSGDLILSQSSPEYENAPNCHQGASYFLKIFNSCD